MLNGGDAVNNPLTIVEFTGNYVVLLMAKIKTFFNQPLTFT